jgi:SAM-dependent methyltransferase
MSDVDRFVNRDQAYLRNIQYATGENLNARTQLHTKYQTATVSLHVWLRQRIEVPAHAAVLDVGCGTGLLWTQGATDMSNDFALTLTDLSPGMVSETLPKVAAFVTSVRALAADAQYLPFADSSFDVVVANQMLYHVPEPSRAIAEFARVLRPAGVVLTSTVGGGHLRELFVIEATVFGPTRRLRHHEVFGPESGRELLLERFGDVEWHAYDDELHCTDAEDVVAYICSTPPGEDASSDQVERLRSEVQRRMSENAGVLVIAKHVGAFTAHV